MSQSEALSDRLNNLLKHLGKNQIELGQILGIGQTMISQMMNGKRNASYKILKRISQLEDSIQKTDTNVIKNEQKVISIEDLIELKVKIRLLEEEKRQYWERIYEVLRKCESFHDLSRFTHPASRKKHISEHG